jgi:hypothetical protein
MMIRKMAGLAMLLLAAPMFGHSNCSIQLQSTPDRDAPIARYNVQWTTVSGATKYVLERSPDNFLHVVETTYEGTRLNSPLVESIEYQRTVETKLAVRITAYSATNAFAPCSATADLLFPADRAFRDVMQRSIIPLVGSAPGAYNSNFKTDLRLRATQEGQKGKLVFHALDVPASTFDPVIPYAFEKAGDEIFFDDVVALFGRVGLGSIDIVPSRVDGKLTVPFAEVRLYNVTPTGNFGAFESQTQPFPWKWPGSATLPRNSFSGDGYVITVPDASSRLNVGVRTFAASTISVEIKRGRSTIGNRSFEVAADTLTFTNAAGFTGRSDLQPGDTIIIKGKGQFVPLFTVTDNRTNDPALFFPIIEVDLDVEDYDAGDWTP